MNYSKTSLLIFVLGSNFLFSALPFFNHATFHPSLSIARKLPNDKLAEVVITSVQRASPSGIQTFMLEINQSTPLFKYVS